MCVTFDTIKTLIGLKNPEINFDVGIGLSYSTVLHSFHSGNIS